MLEYAELLTVLLNVRDRELTDALEVLAFSETETSTMN